MRSSVVLPEPFGPGQADAVPLLDVPGHVLEEDALAVALGEAFDVDHADRPAAVLRNSRQACWSIFAVLRVHEVQAVLVDDLDLHAPPIPSSRWRRSLAAIFSLRGRPKRDALRLAEPRRTCRQRAHDSGHRATSKPLIIRGPGMTCDDDEAATIMVASIWTAQPPSAASPISTSPPATLGSLDAKGYRAPDATSRRRRSRGRSPGKDLVVQSRTGTGKTAAFGIPIVEKVDAAARRRPGGGAGAHPRAGDPGGAGAHGARPRPRREGRDRSTAATRWSGSSRASGPART